MVSWQNAALGLSLVFPLAAIGMWAGPAYLGPVDPWKCSAPRLGFKFETELFRNLPQYPDTARAAACENSFGATPAGLIAQKGFQQFAGALLGVALGVALKRLTST